MKNYSIYSAISSNIAFEQSNGNIEHYMNSIEHYMNSPMATSNTIL